jgi:BolA protein
MQETITRRLREGISCTHLEVLNESGRHAVPPGSASHFKVVVVSGEFEGHSRVQRHRRVNQLLADQFQRGLHALAIHTYTAGEWARLDQAPPSPPCKGGQH